MMFDLPAAEQLIRRRVTGTVTAVLAERQRLDPVHGTKRQRGMKVREQRAAARRLPSERGSQDARIDSDEQQIPLPGKVSRSGLRDLIGRREVDEAVRQVDGGAREHAAVLRFAPQRGVADLVDRRHHTTTVSGRAARVIPV
jgi:hypothetical protein